MTSILTNSGSMIALQTLQATQQSLMNTEKQISTGLRVSNAKDDASTWVVATTMKSNVASLQQVSQDLGNADSILGTAVAGTNSITDLVKQIRAKVASVTDTSTNVAATQAEVTQLVNQIGATITSSAFNGVNLLNASNPTGLTFVAATANDYTVAGTASTTIATGATTDLSSTSGNAAATAFYAMASTLSTLTSTTLDAALAKVDAYNSTVETASAGFGAVQSNIEAQKTFVNNLASSFQTGAGNMVDADMTAESARLSALQTQQQLGTQALSIANQAPQSILKLFG